MLYLKIRLFGTKVRKNSAHDYTSLPQISQAPSDSSDPLRSPPIKNTDYVKRFTEYVKSYFKKVLYPCTRADAL